MHTRYERRSTESRKLFSGKRMRFKAFGPFAFYFRERFFVVYGGVFGSRHSYRFKVFGAHHRAYAAAPRGAFVAHRAGVTDEIFARGSYDEFASFSADSLLRIHSAFAAQRFGVLEFHSVAGDVEIYERVAFTGNDERVVSRSFESTTEAPAAVTAREKSGKRRNGANVETRRRRTARSVERAGGHDYYVLLAVRVHGTFDKIVHYSCGEYLAAEEKPAIFVVHGIIRYGTRRKVYFQYRSGISSVRSSHSTSVLRAGIRP